MEKALYELTIDPELRDLIPPLIPADMENLAQSIARDGCEEDLVVWNGVIIDGHNRYKICHALGIPFSYREKEFSSREEAKMWMIQRSFGRRNMSMYDKAVLALRYEGLLKEEAEVRMKSGVKADPPQNSAEGSEKGDTRDKLAALAGVSHDYIERVKKLEEVIDEKTRGKLSRGETTVNKVYTRLYPKAAHRRAPEETGDSFEDVKQAVEALCNGFLNSLERILSRYSGEMVSDENNAILLELADRVTAFIKGKIQEH